MSRAHMSRQCVRALKKTKLATTMSASECSESSLSTAGAPALLVQKLDKDAHLPVRGTASAAGYDLSALVECTVPAHGKALVKTGLAIAVPPGTYGRIAPRSSLAWKKHIDVGAGVIDADYRGPVGIVLFNHSEHDLKILPGERVAQLILERICTPPVTQVAFLDTTVRAAGGFGSTGK